jgi:hypothetical protein
MQTGCGKSLIIAVLLAITLVTSRFLNYISDDLNFRVQLALYY